MNVRITPQSDRRLVWLHIGATAATLWLASGEAPEWVARQLGHASTQMLFQVYSLYVPNMTRQDGSAIDRLLATRFATTNVAATEPAAPAAPKP